MTLSEITEAVDNGKSVCWENDNYQVIDSKSGYLIKCQSNDNCIGLIWSDGKTMNGKPEEFYIKKTITTEEFDEILKDILEDDVSVGELLAISGIYEILAEHYNNDVLKLWNISKGEQFWVENQN